jgi:hypothetical protein
MEHLKADVTNCAPATKESWKAPTLTDHGTFSELTQFTTGTGPDDGFFDPGAASSAA